NPGARFSARNEGAGARHDPPRASPSGWPAEVRRSARRTGTSSFTPVFSASERGGATRRGAPRGTPSGRESATVAAPGTPAAAMEKAPVEPAGDDRRGAAHADAIVRPPPRRRAALAAAGAASLPEIRDVRPDVLEDLLARLHEGEAGRARARADLAR